MIPETMGEMVKPPFPDQITFQQTFDALFKRDFMTEEEFKTICDAAEMYANGCLKQMAEELERKEKEIDWNKVNSALLWAEVLEYLNSSAALSEDEEIQELVKRYAIKKIYHNEHPN